MDFNIARFNCDAHQEIMSDSIYLLILLTIVNFFSASLSSAFVPNNGIPVLAERPSGTLDLMRTLSSDSLSENYFSTDNGSYGIISLDYDFSSATNAYFQLKPDGIWAYSAVYEEGYTYVNINFNAHFDVYYNTSYSDLSEVNYSTVISESNYLSTLNLERQKTGGIGRSDWNNPELYSYIDLTSILSQTNVNPLTLIVSFASISDAEGLSLNDSSISLEISGEFKWLEENALFVDVVPEPSTYALLLGGTVLGYAFWRRKK